MVAMWNVVREDSWQGVSVESEVCITAMKCTEKRFRTRSLLLLVVSATLISSWNVARADSLYWATTNLAIGSVRIGYDFAQNALRAKGAQNIRVSAIEVAGSIGRTYVAITCIGTTPRVTAVIMAVGADANETSRVRDEVRDYISNIRPID